MTHQLQKKAAAGILAILVIFLIHCSKPADKAAPHPAAVEFMEYINGRLSRFEGFKIEADLENSPVEKINGDRYLVTLKNIVFTADTGSIYKLWLRSYDSILRDDIPMGLDVLKIEEVALVYDTGEKEFELKYAKGLRTDRDVSKLVRQDYKVGGIMDWLVNWKLKRARLYIKNVSFENVQSSLLFKTKQKGAPQTTDNPGNPPPKVDVEGIRLNFDCEENIAVVVEVERVKNSRTGSTNDELSRYVMQKNPTTLDIKDILQKGLPISDSGTEFGKISLSITKNNRQLAKGTLDSFSTSTFFGLNPEKEDQKTDQEEENLVYRMGFGLENLQLSFLHKKYKTVSIGLSQGDASLSLENINPGALDIMVEFLKKSIELRDSADEPAIQNYMKVKGEQFFAALTESKSLANGFSLGIKNLKITCPGAPTLEMLGDIEECRLKSTFVSENPKTLAPYFKPSPEVIETITALPAILPDMMMKGWQMLPQLMQAGMRMKYSISPLKHYFGELSIESDFQPKAQALKSSIKIKKVDDFFNKLARSGLVAPHILMLFQQGLLQVAIRDGNGNASIDFEIKEGQPEIIYLNGFPMRVPFNMFKTQMPAFGFGN